MYEYIIGGIRKSFYIEDKYCVKNLSLITHKYDNILLYVSDKKLIGIKFGNYHLYGSENGQYAETIEIDIPMKNMYFDNIEIQQNIKLYDENEETIEINYFKLSNKTKINNVIEENILCEIGHKYSDELYIDETKKIIYFPVEKNIYPFAFSGVGLNTFNIVCFQIIENEEHLDKNAKYLYLDNKLNSNIISYKTLTQNINNLIHLLFETLSEEYFNVKNNDETLYEYYNNYYKKYNNMHLEYNEKYGKKIKHQNDIYIMKKYNKYKNYIQNFDNGIIDIEYLIMDYRFIIIDDIYIFYLFLKIYDIIKNKLSKTTLTNNYNYNNYNNIFYSDILFIINKIVYDNNNKLPNSLLRIERFLNHKLYIKDEKYKDHDKFNKNILFETKNVINVYNKYISKCFNYLDFDDEFNCYQLAYIMDNNKYAYLLSSLLFMCQTSLMATTIYISCNNNYARKIFPNGFMSYLIFFVMIIMIFCNAYVQRKKTQKFREIFYYENANIIQKFFFSCDYIVNSIGMCIILITMSIIIAYDSSLLNILQNGTAFYFILSADDDVVRLFKYDKKDIIFDFCKRQFKYFINKITL